MYNIDPKFFNEDGSINFETACASGKKEHARALRGGMAFVINLPRNLLRAAGAAVSAVAARIAAQPAKQ